MYKRLLWTLYACGTLYIFFGITEETKEYNKFHDVDIFLLLKQHLVRKKGVLNRKEGVVKKKKKVGYLLYSLPG